VPEVAGAACEAVAVDEAGFDMIIFFIFFGYFRVLKK
jgi:hypothetical protein